MKKVKFKPSEKSQKSISKGVSLVVTYHPSLNCLHKIIKDNTYLLYINQKVKNFFVPVPMVSFRGKGKLTLFEPGGTIWSPTYILLLITFY